MEIPHADIELSRRDALKIAVASPLALWLSSVTGLTIEAAQESARRRFLPLILLYLEGGASYKETWNPDPPSAPVEYRGELRSIPTRITGHHFCELWPGMAERADQLAIIRSINSGDHNHSPALINVIKPGSTQTIAHRWGQRSAAGGPPYALVSPPFGMFFAPLHQPGDALSIQWEAATPPAPAGRGTYIPPSMEAPAGLEAREALRRSIDTASIRGPVAETMERNRATALSLLLGRGDFLRAFHPTRGVQLDKLPEGERVVVQRDLQRFERDLERYGDNHVGRSLLLARRLVERGTGSVAITHGDNQQIDWDDHSNIFPNTRRKAPPLDRAVSALLDDLRRDRFEAVLAIVTEFGRTPRVNGSRGRDHWAAANTIVLAGGPHVRKGVVVGRTHHDGSVLDGELRAADGAVANTIIAACGGRELLAETDIRARDALQ